MRTKKNVFAALAVAAVVATSGSAFTATSTIDKAAVNVGSVAQSVSGATVTEVVHTYTAATDTTTVIDAKAAQLLSTAAGVVKVYLNSSSTADAGGCTVTHADGPDTDTLVDHSTINCNITDTVNLTSVRFVVNG